MLRHRVFELTAALALMAGCGPSDESSLAGSGQDIAEGKVPTLQAEYTVTLDSVVVTKESPDAESVNNVSQVLGLVGFVQDGGSFSMTFRLCRATLPASGSISPTIKDKVLQLVPPTSATGSIASDGAFTTEPLPIQIGMKLENPLSDALPTAKGSPLLVDLEQDGNAGVSVQVSPFEIYGAFRFIYTFTGAVEGDQVSGAADVETDASILGDNIPLVDAAEKVAEAEESTIVVSQKNTFRMVAAAEGATCSDVLDQ